MSADKNQIARWSRIRRIAGVGGTYCYGERALADMSEDQTKEFYVQAFAQRLRPVVRNKILYLEVLP
jgi:hypothetical protein